jgi:hypothetical protein
VTDGPETPESRDPLPEPSGPATENVPTWGDFFFIGTACAISVVVAGGGGYLLDSWLGTTPWLTFAGLAFGITAAVLLAYANFRKFV